MIAVLGKPVAGDLQLFLGEECRPGFLQDVVDAGENIQQITCPRCDQDIPLDWYGDLIEEAEGEFDSLIVTVPCCETAVALDTLKFDWPSGFARFEIAVANPARAEYTFTHDEISAVEAILGHPLRQVVAHI